LPGSVTLKGSEERLLFLGFYPAQQAIIIGCYNPLRSAMLIIS